MTRPMRHTLLCTVGTSLFAGNLARLGKDTPGRPPNWEHLRRAHEDRDWTRVADELLQVLPEARTCGAEINTISCRMPSPGTSSSTVCATWCG